MRAMKKKDYKVKITVSPNWQVEIEVIYKDAHSVHFMDLEKIGEALAEKLKDSLAGNTESR